jgi:hypothetical protein
VVAEASPEPFRGAAPSPSTTDTEAGKTEVFDLEKDLRER